MTTPRPLAYLDNAATTPMRPEAVTAMLPHLGEQYGNPTGSHSLARAARAVIEDAREELAAALGCDPGEVVFTGSGTEANNLAVASAASGPVLCSAVEHHAVLVPVTQAGGATIPVDADGRVQLAAIEGDATFVSVMLANNETGVVQSLGDVRARFPSAVLHTDAVAAFCWVDLAATTAMCDLVSISAHKFGGPKGVGALVVRDGVKVAPIIRGGGQERERRSGTHNVAGIVAMAAAASATVREREATIARVEGQREQLRRALLDVSDVTITAPSAPHTAGTLHALVGGVESESLLIALDDLGVCASAGASCASGALEPSHVLAAMNVDPVAAKGALRLSLGWSTTDADIDRACVALPKAIESLRVAR